MFCEISLNRVETHVGRGLNPIPEMEPKTAITATEVGLILNGESKEMGGEREKVGREGEQFSKGTLRGAVDETNGLTSRSS